MEPISRRAAIGLGLAGAVSAAVGAGGLARLGWPPLGAAGQGPGAVGGGEGLRQPTVLQAVGGVLDVELVASRSTLDIGGRPARLTTYNGGSPGPTLALAPGDLLRVLLVNDLDAPTNLHVHGLHVPPTGAGDDPKVQVDPGSWHQYEYRIPANHPTGLFWYHPHHHGTVADQVFAGLFGAILIGEPAVTADARLLVVSDLTVDGAGTVTDASSMDRMTGREGALVLLNGQLRPVVEVASGGTERWYVLNACVSRYLDLHVADLQWTVNGLDGGADPTPVRRAGVRLLPGNRADLLVPAPPAEAWLRTATVDRTGMGMGMGDASSTSGPGATDIALVRPVDGARRVPVDARVGTAARDLRASAAARHRTIVLGGAMGMGRMSFTINGQVFDPSRSDLDVELGTVEEWTFENRSMMNHPVHLHVWPMQVVARDGQRVDPVLWRDVVDVTAGGTTTVRVAFDDYPGATVLHCHILDHEDLGMMAQVTCR